VPALGWTISREVRNDGAAHWHTDAKLLLADINALRLPLPALERLRDIDAMKRAAEIIGTVRFRA
jgi:hypothetical protein